MKISPFRHRLRNSITAVLKLSVLVCTVLVLVCMYTQTFTLVMYVHTWGPDLCRIVKSDNSMTSHSTYQRKQSSPLQPILEIDAGTGRDGTTFLAETKDRTSTTGSFRERIPHSRLGRVLRIIGRNVSNGSKGLPLVHTLDPVVVIEYVG